MSMFDGLTGPQRTRADRCAAMLRWYRVHGRHVLPWRCTRDPYAILVSEIMLQQTQVDRVIPYWHAWMRRWPTIASLARARRASVIRAWAGLGYNRRAVHFHELAQQVTRDVDWKGSFSYSYLSREGSAKWDELANKSDRDLEDAARPMRGIDHAFDAKKLQELPGIGPYTANALLAFAGNLPAPCVDTNIRRVLAHIIYRRPAIMTMPLPKVMMLAARVIPEGRGREWNYALMDYGALVFRASDVPNRVRRRVAPFKNSSRFWRGRIVAALRETKKPLTRAQLLVRLTEHGDPPDALETLLAALERDRVVRIVRAAYRLA